MALCRVTLIIEKYRYSERAEVIIWVEIPHWLEEQVV